LDIDLVRLARFAGARLIVGAATRLDPVSRTVHVPGRPPVGFDLCSIDVGITSSMPDLPGFAEHAIPAKPLGAFATAWSGYLNQDGPARIAAIGAGVAGVELALAMAHALKSRDRAAQVTLIDRGQALTAVHAASAAKLRASLADAGVVVRENAPVVSITDESVVLADDVI
ncbi:unnamed protein product, partial [Ectocarpus sp. 12 AP-2014]